MATKQTTTDGKSVPRIALDHLDELVTKTSKLDALLQMTYGNAAKTLNCMNDELRGDYLLACSDLARDCKAIASRIAGGPHGA